MSSQSTEPGKILVLWGTHGAPGRTTLAANIALELVKAEQSVCLIDADCVSPSLSQLFAIDEHAAGITAATRLVGQSRFDREQFLRLAKSIEIANRELFLLTGMPTPSRWSELMPDRIEELLEVARENFEFVVVDVSASLEARLIGAQSATERNSATLTALRMADRVIAVCAADQISVHRFLWALQDLRAIKIEAEITVVVNRLRSSVLGSSAARQVSDTLARLAQVVIAAFIPDDPIAFDQALLSGKPVALGKRGSSARQAISTFVRGQLLNQRNHLDRVVAKLG